VALLFSCCAIPPLDFFARDPNSRNLPDFLSSHLIFRLLLRPSSRLQPASFRFSTWLSFTFHLLKGLPVSMSCFLQPTCFIHFFFPHTCEPQPLSSLPVKSFTVYPGGPFQHPFRFLISDDKSIKPRFSILPPRLRITSPSVLLLFLQKFFISIYMLNVSVIPFPLRRSLPLSLPCGQATKGAFFFGFPLSRTLLRFLATSHPFTISCFAFAIGNYSRAALIFRAIRPRSPQTPPFSPMFLDFPQGPFALSVKVPTTLHLATSRSKPLFSASSANSFLLLSSPPRLYLLVPRSFFHCFF